MVNKMIDNLGIDVTMNENGIVSLTMYTYI